MSEVYNDRSNAGTPRPGTRHGDEALAEPRSKPNYAPGPDGGTSAQIEQVMDVLVRRRWTLLATWLLILGVVAAYTFTRVPQYQADSYIMVDLDQIGSLAGDVALGSPGFGTSGKLATELFILETSLQIEERVTERLIEQQGDVGTGIGGGTEEPLALERGAVEVAPADRDVPNAIRVTATSEVPDEAALLANLYTEEYIRLAREANRTHLSARRAFLDEQLTERREELRKAEEAVKAYTMRHGTVGLDQETNYLVSNIASLESRRDDARIELRTRQASLETLESELETINPKLVERFSSGVERQMEGVQAKLSELEQQKEQILLRNPQLSPDDEEQLGPINEQIAALQQKMDDLSQEYVNEVIAAGGVSNSEGGLAHIADLKRQVVRDRIEINAMESRIEMMDGRLRSHEGELANVPELSLDLARLERDRMYAEEQYHSVMQNLQQARLAEESQTGYAQVIREARVPWNPVSPNIPRNLALGLMLGLFAGLAVAVVRDKMDNRINKPDELRARGYSLIGVIPNMQSLFKEEYGGKEFTLHEGRPVATSLVTLLNPMSSLSEAYRSARTAIQFSQPDKVVQTLLVTSPSVGEGKSTTAANLAIAMAQSGRRTLLIDADMRRPRQHSLFGLSNEKGLVQLVFNKLDKLDVFKATSQEDLTVIPAGGFVESNRKEISRESGSGTSVSNPAELLGSKRMRELLAEFRDEFDVIVIDTPPVLAATDAPLLSTQCDGSLVVTRAGHTKNGELEFSLDVLRDVGATVTGTLLNAFDISLAYGYMYRFGSYSAYGYHSQYSYGYGMSQDKSKQSSPWWQFWKSSESSKQQSSKQA